MQKSISASIKIFVLLVCCWLLLGLPGPAVEIGIPGSMHMANAQTQNVLTKGIIPEKCRQQGIKPTDYDNKECGFIAFLQLFINISQFILGIVGSLALLFFVYGGITFLTSAGSAERIAQGKRTLIAAVIGIAIVMGSYVVINFIVSPFISNWQSPGDGQIQANP